jgi:serine/threonine protein kinase
MFDRYIATELCLCSVADLFQQNSSEDDKSKAAEILSSLSAKGILFQATRGLDYLHQNHFVHRNVKPSSFLIKEIQSSNSSNRYAVKITDFRLSRQLDQGKDLSGTVASEGWEAPESRREKQPLHQSLDVFILGCFYHYVLTGTDDGVDSSPTHPFGNTEMARLVNIPNTKNEVYQKTWIPKGISNRKATDLIKRMIQFNEKDRPTLSQILEDAYFQPATKEVYPIYTYDKPGLCVIFNQELFTKVYNKSSKKFILT